MAAEKAMAANRPSAAAGPAASASRKTAAESAQSGTQTVWVVDLPSGQPRQFTTMGAGAVPPTVSPNGQMVAFDSGGMVIMPVDGGEPVRRFPMRSQGLGDTR